MMADTSESSSCLSDSVPATSLKRGKRVPGEKGRIADRRGERGADLAADQRLLVGLVLLAHGLDLEGELVAPGGVDHLSGSGEPPAAGPAADGEHDRDLIGSGVFGAAGLVGRQDVIEELLAGSFHEGAGVEQLGKSGSRHVKMPG